MKKLNLFVLCMALGVFGLSSTSFSEETNLEKAQTTANKSGDAVKKAYRDTDDRVCQELHGKLECIPRKLKHKASNASDTAKTKAKQIQNKTD